MDKNWQNGLAHTNYPHEWLHSFPPCSFPVVYPPFMPKNFYEDTHNYINKHAQWNFRSSSCLKIALSSTSTNKSKKKTQNVHQMRFIKIIEIPRIYILRTQINFYSTGIWLNTQDNLQLIFNWFLSTEHFNFSLYKSHDRVIYQ